METRLSHEIAAAADVMELRGLKKGLEWSSVDNSEGAQ